MTLGNASLLGGNSSTYTPASYPCQLEDELYNRSADVAMGTLHVMAGILAILGNGVVFFSYLKEAGQRASACMFVQLAVAGVLVGYTSIYGGVYLLRGRNHVCNIVEHYPEVDVKLPSQHFFELSVGHTWWYGYTCTIMLVTTLSAIRAWSIARPFKYKMRSSHMETALLSAFCWLYGIMWIGARYIVHCQWMLQTFFTFSVPSCPNTLAYKLIIFPLDVIPVLCGAVFTTISNTYVINELAKSYRNPPTSDLTREAFSKTTLLIVLLTSFFLVCYTPTMLFYFLNSLEIVTDYEVSVFPQLTARGFITVFTIKFVIPTLYPALSPALQFCGVHRYRERFSFRSGQTFLSAVSKRSNKLTGQLAAFRRTTRSTQVLGQTISMPIEQNSPQFTHTIL